MKKPYEGLATVGNGTASFEANVAPNKENAMNTTQAQTKGVPVKVLFDGQVEVGKIKVQENVRTDFNADEQAQLTADIRDNGLINAIILVKNDDGTFKLVAGERRLRAIKTLKHPTIHGKVVEADEAKQAAIQLSENIQRKNLNPIETARGYRKLLDDGQFSEEGLAEHVHKDVEQVARTVRLLKLPARLVRAIEEGTLSPEYGHQVLRLPEAKWKDMADWVLTKRFGGIYPTIHEVKKEIENRFEKDLSRACFPQDKEYANLPACKGCPFNTKKQDLLFDDAKPGKCTNGSCFTKKTNHFYKELRESNAKRYPDLKFAGFGSEERSSREVKGATVLTPEESKSAQVKKALEKEPGKFGFAILKPSRWGSKTPRVVLVCHDQEFVASKLRKAEQTRQAPQMSEAEREREEFVERTIVQALFTEAAKAIKAIKKKHLVDVVLSLNGSEEAYRAVGVEESEDLAQALMKLSEKDLLKLAVLCSVEYHNLDEEVAALGVAVAKVRKEARGEALTAWKEMEAAQKAEAEQMKKEEAATK